MKNARRRLLAICTIASLVACVAIVALWATSPWHNAYVRRVTLDRGGDLHLVRVAWYGSGIQVSTLEEASQWPSKEAGPLRPTPRIETGWREDGLGSVAAANMPAALIPVQFEVSLSTSNSRADNSGVTVPAWLLVAAFGVLPAIRFVRWHRRRRRRIAGQCIACGYDLRHAGTMSGVRDDFFAGDGHVARGRGRGGNGSHPAAPLHYAAA